MTVELGFAPEDMNVHLTPRADFLATIQTADGTDWPDGTVLTLRIETTPTATDLPATVAGPLASWNVDKAAVAALGYRVPLAARLLYSNDAGVDIAYFVGRVVWHA